MQSSRLNAVVPAKSGVVLADIHRVRAFGPTVAAALQTSPTSSSVASGICRPGDGDRDANPVGGARGSTRTITHSLGVSFVASTPSTKFVILAPNLTSLASVHEEEPTQAPCPNSVVPPTRGGPPRRAPQSPCLQTLRRRRCRRARTPRP